MPEWRYYWYHYGIFLCGQGRTEQAIDQFLQAADNKFYRTPEFALDNAGVCAMQAGRHDLADQHFRDAIRQSAVFAPAILHMAELNIRRELGDSASADRFAEQLIKAYPRSSQARTVLASQ